MPLLLSLLSTFISHMGLNLTSPLLVDFRGRLLNKRTRLALIFQVVDRLDELPEVNREQVEGAGKELADAAVKVLAQGLKMRNREVLFLRVVRVVFCCFHMSSSPYGSHMIA